MLLSPETYAAARRRFDSLLTGPAACAAPAIRTALEGLDPDDAQALVWCYAASPLSDWLNTPPALFRSLARHGVMLRRTCPYAARLPEDIFLNYVLHPRVNEEELSDCRRAMYDELSPLLAGLPEYQAAVRVNYWNASQVTYRLTDDRTISAAAAWRCGFGRCGEESTFAVNAYRAVGIPARQIYTPRWAHCDDNHAWVEVWVDGSWHFLGACEPEETLDRGWFTAAAARALLLHTRCFGDPVGEEIISRSGMVTLLNQTRRYAPVRTLTVRVTDRAGAPLPGAAVFFEILNACQWFPAARVPADRQGLARLTCGRGSLRVRAVCGEWSAQEIISGDAETVTLTLPESEKSEISRDISVCPGPVPMLSRDKTPPVPVLSQEKKRLAAAIDARKRRIAHMEQDAEAMAAGLPGGELLLQAPANRENLAEFLENSSFSLPHKQALLAALSPKDLQDVTPEVLAESLSVPGPCPELPEDVYFRYVACPRIDNEPLRPQRRQLLHALTDSQKEHFRRDPQALYAWLTENIHFFPQEESPQLTTLPAAALASRAGSPLSRDALFAALCRALGVPARLHPADREPQFWQNGQFRSAATGLARGSFLILENPMAFGTDFGLTKQEDEQALDLSSYSWKNGQMTVDLLPGRYTVITDSRLPCGDIHARTVRFSLDNGEKRRIPLEKVPVFPEEMTVSCPLPDFTVRSPDGRELAGRELTRTPALLAWLEVGREPTEHLLGELRDRAAALAGMDIVLLVPDLRDRADPLLAEVCRVLPRCRVLLGGRPNALARNVFLEPGRLPLVLVTDGPLHAVYAAAGYRVGGVQLAETVLRQAKEGLR